MNTLKYHILIFIFGFLSVACKTEFHYNYYKQIKKTRFCTATYYDSTGLKLIKRTKFPLSEKSIYTNYYCNGKREKKTKVVVKIGVCIYGYPENLPYGTHKFWNEEGDLIRKEKYSRMNHELKKSKTY